MEMSSQTSLLFEQFTGQAINPSNAEATFLKFGNNFIVKQVHDGHQNKITACWVYINSTYMFIALFSCNNKHYFTGDLNSFCYFYKKCISSINHKVFQFCIDWVPCSKENWKFVIGFCPIYFDKEEIF